LGDSETYGSDWSEEDVRLVVMSYFHYRDLDLRQQPFVKLHVYKELAAKIGRTHKSVERKIQYISSDVIAEQLDRFIWKEEGGSGGKSSRSHAIPCAQI